MSLTIVASSTEVAGNSTAGKLSPVSSVDDGRYLPDSEAATPDSASVVQALDDIRSAVQSVHRNLEFSFNEDAGMTVVTVTDSESGEVVRQIPSEVLVKLAANFKEASNLLFSERV
ncbi:flagellar protein FlaG [Pseudomonas sp. LRF_L74]|uniref:flagellar protein FlaG n=1 Tax=Pseudomonas sp. LRF_L74 TaxID=3369422 RepID=UPI003F63BBE9